MYALTWPRGYLLSLDCGSGGLVECESIHIVGIKDLFAAKSRALAQVPLSPSLVLRPLALLLPLSR